MKKLLLLSSFLIVGPPLSAHDGFFDYLKNNKLAVTAASSLVTFATTAAYSYTQNPNFIHDTIKLATNTGRTTYNFLQQGSVQSAASYLFNTAIQHPKETFLAFSGLTLTWTSSWLLAQKLFAKKESVIHTSFYLTKNPEKLDRISVKSFPIPDLNLTKRYPFYYSSLSLARRKKEKLPNTINCQKPYSINSSLNANQSSASVRFSPPSPLSTLNDSFRESSISNSSSPILEDILREINDSLNLENKKLNGFATHPNGNNYYEIWVPSSLASTLGERPKIEIRGSVNDISLCDYKQRSDKSTIAEQLVNLYKIHLMPRSKDQYFLLLKTIALELHQNEEFRSNFEQFKVWKDVNGLYEQGNALPTETQLFNSDNQILPIMVIYPAGSKKSAQYILNFLVEQFGNLEGLDITPRYNEKVTSLIYYAQGDGTYKDSYASYYTSNGALYNVNKFNEEVQTSFDQNAMKLNYPLPKEKIAEKSTSHRFLPTRVTRDLDSVLVRCKEWLALTNKKKFHQVIFYKDLKNYQGAKDFFFHNLEKESILIPIQNIGSLDLNDTQHDTIIILDCSTAPEKTIRENIDLWFKANHFRLAIILAPTSMDYFLNPSLLKIYREYDQEQKGLLYQHLTKSRCGEIYPLVCTDEQEKIIAYMLAKFIYTPSTYLQPEESLESVDSETIIIDGFNLDNEEIKRLKEKCQAVITRTNQRVIILESASKSSDSVLQALLNHCNRKNLVDQK